MGITYEDARVLCDAALDGVSFERTLTLGHQRSYLTAKQLSEFAGDLAVAVPWELLVPNAYSDDFFSKFLGASTLESMDASAFEGATVLHDLNLRVPEERDKSFDAVIDSGTLEHVFNFPVALANCMRMVRVGGRLFVFTNGNNFMGHGFYQFSPELFYRSFSHETGFEIEQMTAVEYRFIGAEFGSLQPWYSVVDPDVVRRRVMVTNELPLGLLIRAKKIEHRGEPFERFPIQSDYARSWSNAGVREERLPSGVKNVLRRTLPTSLLARINKVRTYWHNRRSRHTIFSLKNRNHFIPIAPSGLRPVSPGPEPTGRRRRA